MARINVAKNFAGQTYATEEFVEGKIGTLPEGVESVIDAETGNLNSELNPIAVASMQNATGSTDFSKIKIIGDCSVIYGTNGTITLRIGPALNCSLLNGKDGISTATVTYAHSGTETATVSDDYSSTNNTGSRTIVVKGDSDTATMKCGTTATTATAAGNSVHFEDASNGYFKVYIGSGKNADTVNAYLIGPITGNDTFYEDSTNKSIACAITNFKDEPKISSGANGKCANVNFTFTPEKMFTTSTDYKIIKIEQLESNDVVATWTNSTATVYMFMAETTTPGTPSSATYTLSKKTKQISGVTYLTTETTMTASAVGLKNCGYPASVTNKANCSASGGAWFTGYNSTATTDFTTWTDDKDATMNWQGASTGVLIGAWDNPQVIVKGTNMHGSGTGATSAVTNNKIYVCDANGYTSTTHGSFSESNRLDSDFKAVDPTFSSQDLSAEGNTDLQIFNGYVVYPKTDFSAYNMDGETEINPDYSACTGDRYFYVKLSKTGTIMGGTINFGTDASAKTSIENGSLKIELSNDNSTWMDIGKNASNGGIGATFSYGTSNAISFSIPSASNYGSGFLYARITMTSDVDVKLGSISLS